MGTRDKLLEDIDGTPLLRRRAETCLASNVDAVRVVLPPDRAEREQALSGLELDIVHNDGSALGISHSLKRGFAELGTDAALIVLADLPDLTATDLNKLIDAARAHPLAKVLRGATLDGKAGHPVLLRRTLFSEIERLGGDVGAQPLFKRHQRDTVLVPIGPAALRDLDTPEDWASWRADQKT